MDIIRETSYYATQLESNTLAIQAARQLLFANIWLNFVRKKKSFTGTWKNSTTLPMWLLPGIHFLRHICALQFTNHINDEIFSKFYENMQKTIDYLHYPSTKAEQKQLHLHIRIKKSSKPFQLASSTKHGYDKHKKKTVLLSRIEKIELMDRKIDRQRFKDGLIGKIKGVDERSVKMPQISKRMEEDLAFLKIRNFHKLNLLSRGQFATSKSLLNLSKPIISSFFSV